MPNAERAMDLTAAPDPAVCITTATCLATSPRAWGRDPACPAVYARVGPPEMIITIVTWFQ